MYHVATSSSGGADIVAGIKSYRLAWLLAAQEIRQRYRRSTLGPLWITISMSVVIISLGIVFSQVLRTPITELLVFMSAGIIFWTFIQTTVNEGCESFIAADALIKQGLIPLFVHVERVVFRNFLILMHNLLILPFVFLGCGKLPSFVNLLTIPGLVLLTINIVWVVLFIAVVATRYRDIAQVVASVLQIMFYLTPIIWLPDVLSPNLHVLLVDLNPLSHLIAIVRAPLLNQVPQLSTWLVVIALAVFGWTLTLFMYDRYRRRIPYWL